MKDQLVLFGTENSEMGQIVDVSGGMCGKAREKEEGRKEGEGVGLREERERVHGLSSPERWAGRGGRGLEVSSSQTMTRIK